MNTSEYIDLKDKTYKLIKEKYRKSLKNIINDIDTILKASDLCNKKCLPFSSLSYQVKTIKYKNNDILCQIVKVYQDIIFPELSFNNDINNIISSPSSLSLWLLRYCCLQLCEDDFYNKLEENLPGNTITERYQYIDSILFNLTISKKVLNS